MPPGRQRNLLIGSLTYQKCCYCQALNSMFWSEGDALKNGFLQMLRVTLLHLLQHQIWSPQPAGVKGVDVSVVYIAGTCFPIKIYSISYLLNVWRRIIVLCSGPQALAQGRHSNCFNFLKRQDRIVVVADLHLLYFGTPLKSFPSKFEARSDLSFVN